jgi:hypothetical protein
MAHPHRILILADGPEPQKGFKQAFPDSEVVSTRNPSGFSFLLGKGHYDLILLIGHLTEAAGASILSQRGVMPGAVLVLTEAVEASLKSRFGDQVAVARRPCGSSK